jgi:tetratricopeptide (TPR) repeat protein
MRFIGYYIFIGMLCWGGFATAGAPPARSAAGRYLKMLQRKPALGSLFERFYNSWNESEYGELEAFLNSQVKKSGSEGICALWLLARLYEKEGQDSKAVEIYDKLLKRIPGEPNRVAPEGKLPLRGGENKISGQNLTGYYALESNVLLARAQLNFYAGELDAVAVDLELALKSKGITRELKEKCLRLLGRTQIRQDRREQGIKTWRKLIATSGTASIEAEEDIIQLMLDEGMYDNALKMCIVLRKKLPEGYRKVALGVRLGGIYHLKNERLKAVKAFAEILNSVAGDSWIKKELYSRIEREFRLEDNVIGLVEFYQARLKKQPGDILARKRYALLLREQGDNKAAAAQFKTLMKLTPLDYRNREAYLDLLVADKQYSTALTLLKQLIKRAPNDYELLIKQAMIEAKAGNKAACLKAVDRYLQHAGSSEYAWNRVVKLVNAWGFTDAEGPVYRQMTEKFPQSSDAQEAYAKYLYRNGKKSAALDKFRQLVIKPDRTVLLRVVRSLIGLGESKVAYTIMQQHYAAYKDDFKFMLEMFALSFALEQHKASETLIEPLLNLASSSQELNNAIAAVTMELKQVKGTARYLEQLKAQQKLSINQQCLLIELEFNSGATEAAMQKLKQALDANPTSVVLNSRLLYFQKQQGQTGRAIKTLERLLKLEPRRQIQYLREMIRLRLSESSYASALKLVGRWKKNQPAALLPLMTEADIYEQSGKLEQAVKILKKASFKFPENKEINLALAGYYLKNMNYSAAINIFWKTLEQEKSLASRLSLIQRIAELAKESGNREQLLSRLRNRMKSNPQNIFPLLALARVYKVYNNYPQYRYYLVKATENQADNIELLYSLAALDEDEGNYDKAEATLKKIVELDSSGQGAKKLAGFYFRGGEEDKGFALIANDAGATMTPQSIKSTALVMFNAGRYEKTVDFLQKFVAKFPDNYELRYLYAVALEEAGRKEGAVQAFFGLLKMADELKPGKLTKSSSALNQYYKNLPPVAANIIKMRQSFYTIYQYRNRNHRSRYGAATGGMMIPQSKSVLVANIIAHLRGLAGTIGSSDFNDYASRLKVAGIRYADIKMALASRKFHRETAAWENLIEKYSDDVNIIAVDCLAGVYNRQQGGDPEKYEKIIATIVKDHPAIALMVFFSAFQRQIELKPATVKQVIELLKKQQKFSIYMIAGFSAIAKSPAVDKATIAQIAKIIAGVYLKQQPTAGSQPSINYMIGPLAKALIETEDYQTVIKLLQLSLHNLATTPTIPTYMFRHYSRQGLKFAPLAFPPQYSGAAPLFTMLIQPGNKILGSSLEATPERLKKLWLAVEKVDNPELRLIMADYCGELDIANKLADSLVNAEHKKSSSSALVAGYYGKQQKYSAAIKATEQAAKLTKNKQLKKIYYTSAIHYALQLKQDKTAKDQVKELTGKLLRLRLTDREKSSLAEALQVAGLTAEAEKIDQMLLKKLTARKKINPGVRPAATRPRNIHERVKKLLKAGKIEQALKISYRSIKQAASSEISAFRSATVIYNPPWEAKQLVTLLKQNNCQQKFMQRCAPTDDKSARKQLEYAIICQYFGEGERERAVKIYQTLATGDKGNKVAQKKLFLCYMLDDQAKALKVLNDYKLDKLKIVELMLTKVNHDQKIRNNPKLKLQLIDTISAILSQLPAAKQQATVSHLFNNVFQLLENQQYSSKYGNLPGVLTANPEFKAPFIKQKTALHKQKLAVYRRYLDACMQLPSLVEQAFSRKLTVRKLQHKPADETLFKTGVAILKQHKSMRNNYVVYSSRGTVTLLDTREFVITYAVEHDKIDYLKQQLKDNKTAKLIEFAAKLYRCPPAEFITLVEQEPRLDGMKGKIMLAICRVRKLKINLDKTMLHLLAELLGKQVHTQHNAASLAVAYLETLDDDAEHQFKFIQAVTEQIVKRYKTAYPNGMPTNRVSYANQFNYQNFYLLSNLCQQFISSNRMMTLRCADSVLTETAKAKDFIKSANLIYVFTGAMQKMPMAAIKDSPFVADLKDFSFIQIKNSNNNQSLFSSFIRNRRHGEKKDEAVKFIEGLKPQTFGTEFMQACIKERSKAKIFAVCDRYITDFDKLAPERQQQFIVGLKQLFTAIGLQVGNPAQADPGYTFYDKYFAEAERISPLKKAEEFMKKRTVGSNYHKYLNDANDLVGKLAAEHPATAAKVIRHALDRIRLLSLSGKVYTGHMRVEDIFISSFLGYRNKKLAQMGIIYSFMLENRMFNTRTAERFQRRLQSIVNSEWRDAQKKAKATVSGAAEPQLGTKSTASTSGNAEPQLGTKSTPGTAGVPPANKPGTAGVPPASTPPTAAELYLTLLAKSFPGANAPLLFTALYNLKSQPIAALKTVAAKYAALPAPLSRAQREIKLNLAYFLVLKGDNKAVPTGAYIDFYLEFINNPDVPLALKVISGLDFIERSNGVGRLVIALSKPLLKIHSRQNLMFNRNAIGKLAKKLIECPVSDDWRKVALQVAAIRLRDYMLKPGTKTEGALFEALALYCKTGNMEEVVRIVMLPKIVTRQRTYIVLVNYGATEHCRKLIAKNWQTITIAGCDSVILTNKGRQQADKIIGTIKPADQRFLVEIIFATCRNADNRSQAKRLQQLAKQFVTIKFSNKALRQKCLIALARQHITMYLMRPELLELLNSMTPEQLVNQSEKFILEQYSLTLKELFDKREYKKIAVQCEKFFPFMSGVKNRQYTNAERLLKYVMKAYLNSRNNAKETLTLTELKSMAEFEYKIMKKLGPNANQPLFFRTLFLQSITDQEKLTAQWLKQIPEEQLNKLQVYRLKRSFSDSVTKDLKNHFSGYKPAAEKFLDSENLQNVFTSQHQARNLQNTIKQIKQKLK